MKDLIPCHSKAAGHIPVQLFLESGPTLKFDKNMFAHHENTRTMGFPGHFKQNMSTKSKNIQRRKRKKEKETNTCTRIIIEKVH